MNRQQLDALTPFRPFTEADRRLAADHLTRVDGYGRPGQPRVLCAILSVLYEECPQQRALIEEACWMAMRMNAHLIKHHCRWNEEEA